MGVGVQLCRRNCFRSDSVSSAELLTKVAVANESGAVDGCRISEIADVLQRAELTSCDLRASFWLEEA